MSAPAAGGVRCPTTSGLRRFASSGRRLTQPGRSCDDPAGRLIVALDYTEAQPALEMARRLRGLVRTVKVGSILFTACGPGIVRDLRALGFQIMLDLKYLDIPSTVEKSCRAAAHHGVALLTVHAAGPDEMLQAAAAGAREEAQRLGGPRPKVVGVTVLTSVAAKPQGLTRRVVALARRAQRAGLDGVVASAWEAAAIRRGLGRSFLIVCPGIRRESDPGHDQQRVCGPREAVARGADALVVGRPVTAAPDPRSAARAMLDELATDPSRRGGRGKHRTDHLAGCCTTPSFEVRGSRLKGRTGSRRK